MRKYQTLNICLILASACLFLTAHSITAQATEKYCGFEVIETYGANPIRSYNEARQILDDILEIAQLNPTDIRFEPANVGEALAFTCRERDKAIILFDPSRINELVYKSGNEWIIKSIFAHEAGHILQKPLVNRTAYERQKLEIWADEFAGKTLAQLGATRDEIEKTYEVWVSDTSISGYSDHPPLKDRLQAVRRGYEQASSSGAIDFIKGMKCYRIAFNGLLENNFKLNSGVKNNYLCAINSFSQALRKNRLYREAYFNRGNVYYDLGLSGEKKEYNRAIEDYTQAIQLDPDYAIAHLYRGGTYRRMGNYQLAIKDCTDAISLNPDYAPSYLNLGLVFDAMGEFDKAIAQYSKAIEKDNDYSVAYFNRGVAYTKKLDFNKALSDLRKAVQLDPNIASYRGELKDVMEKLKETPATKR
jgi:tetratricopeptide (TPR) repeat protein